MLQYAISYDEVQSYKPSLMSSDTDVFASISTEFAEFVSDNVNLNVCTLDGSGTFHAMGIIVCWTNMTEGPDKKIRRSTKIFNIKEVAKKASIHLRRYNESLGKLQLISMEKLKSNLLDTTSELSIHLRWCDEMKDKSLGKLQSVSMGKLKSNFRNTTSELSIDIYRHIF